MDEGSNEMLAHMAGTVGFALHEERLARATRNLRLIEAAQSATGQRAIEGSYRASLARALTALAARVTPTVMQSNTRTPALAS